MNHLTEEQLVLHYYGEQGDTLEIEWHLKECEDCRGLYGSLKRVLNVLDSAPSPERGADYGAEVWGRIEAKLKPRCRWRVWGVMLAMRWVLAGAAVVVLLTVAFLAGRFYPQHQATPQVAGDAQVRERVLLVAMGDYLDRSQMVLVELANANSNGPLDISSEQERVRQLIPETRLYRQTAANTGDTSVGGILDELERVLLDLARGPSRLSPEELERFRARLRAEGILFKIRVVNSNVRSQEEITAGDVSRQTL